MCTLCLDLLLNAQMYNADQLSGYLLRVVANDFHALKETEEFQKLTVENVAYVRKHGWPPLSYRNALIIWNKMYGEKTYSHVAGKD